MVRLLRSYPVRFSRQKVLGNYIADFYSAEAKLVIELDGSQHYEADEIQKDAARTAFLEGYGLTVIRIPNNEVTRNFRGVCAYIDVAVTQSLSQLRCRYPFGSPGDAAALQEFLPKFSLLCNITYTRTAGFCLWANPDFQRMARQNPPVLLMLERLCSARKHPLSSVSGRQRYNTLDFTQ